MNKTHFKITYNWEKCYERNSNKCENMENYALLYSTYQKNQKKTTEMSNKSIFNSAYELFSYVLKIFA